MKIKVFKDSQSSSNFDSGFMIIKIWEVTFLPKPSSIHDFQGFQSGMETKYERFEKQS